MTIDIKVCSHCKQELPINKFYDNHRTSCKDCMKEYQRVRYKTNPEYKFNHDNYAKKINYKYQKSYLNTEIGKQSYKKYRQSIKGKETIHRCVNRRERNLKFIPIMDNPFPKDIEVDYHHINNLLVIPIPRITHKQFIYPDRNKHRELCNSYIKNLGLII